jgi:hypothetical protein
MFPRPAQPQYAQFVQKSQVHRPITLRRGPCSAKCQALGAASGARIRKMSNYAVWNTRLRHEWLSKPAKGKYLSKRKRSRCGLEEALERKGEGAASAAGDKSSSNA